MASEPLGVVAAIVDGPACASPVADGSPEIVIHTGALAIHVSPGVSVDHIGRVLAAVRLAE